MAGLCKQLRGPALLALLESAYSLPVAKNSFLLLEGPSEDGASVPRGPEWAGAQQEGPPSLLSGLVFYKTDLLTMIHIT